jgi:uncharacterized membrane protein
MNTVGENALLEQVWVIQPTRALNWRQAKRWLCLFSIIPTLNGVLMYAYGVPLVLPFSGLEVAFLWFAFYWVIRTGQWREIVRISDAEVTIEKGFNQPTESHSLPRPWVQVELQRARHAWYPSSLVFSAHGRTVQVGDCLTDGERQALAAALINAIKKTI